MQENYCAYLRKSRADRDAELRGEEETLARHKRILPDLFIMNQITLKLTKNFWGILQTRFAYAIMPVGKRDNSVSVMQAH